MRKVVSNGLSSEADMASWSAPQFIELIQSLTATIESLQHRIEWFERNLFGTKSERLRVLESAQQLSLGDVLASPEGEAPAHERQIAGYTRRTAARDAAAEEAESVPFFDESRVPVETIALKPPELEGAEAGAFEVIGQKVTHRLAQRPGSYVILKYVRPVLKRRATQTIHCAPAPAGVIEGSRADVSFLAGLLVDKFAWHLPLYRQHQRLEDTGITVSRPWLTQLVQRSVGLIEPIYDAQFASIRASRVKAMDETPVKAGRKERGKMRTAYFWPVYGGHNEVCFPYFPSREAAHVYTALGEHPGSDKVLLTDGYAAYASYAKKVGITHALCWTHYPESGVIRRACEERLHFPHPELFAVWIRSRRHPHPYSRVLASDDHAFRGSLEMPDATLERQSISFERCQTDLASQPQCDAAVGEGLPAVARSLREVLRAVRTRSTSRVDRAGCGTVRALVAVEGQSSTRTAEGFDHRISLRLTRLGICFVDAGRADATVAHFGAGSGIRSPVATVRRLPTCRPGQPHPHDR